MGNSAFSSLDSFSRRQLAQHWQQLLRLHQNEPKTHGLFLMHFLYLYEQILLIRRYGCCGFYERVPQAYHKTTLKNSQSASLRCLHAISNSAIFFKLIKLICFWLIAATYASPSVVIPQDQAEDKVATKGAAAHELTCPELELEALRIVATVTVNGGGPRSWQVLANQC